MKVEAIPISCTNSDPNAIFTSKKVGSTYKILAFPLKAPDGPHFIHCQALSLPNLPWKFALGTKSEDTVAQLPLCGIMNSRSKKVLFIHSTTTNSKLQEFQFISLFWSYEEHLESLSSCKNSSPLSSLVFLETAEVINQPWFYKDYPTFIIRLWYKVKLY